MFRYIKRKLSSTPPPSEASSTVCAHSFPPTKKHCQKERGQNKHRPRTKVSVCNQLCPSLYLYKGDESFCRFGDKCRYMHSITDYLASKLPNISDECYMFENYGYCPYGLACRFNSKHISSDYHNLTNELLYNAGRAKSERNLLGKELQERLRKRKEEFPRSDRYLDMLKVESGKSEIEDKGKIEMEEEKNETAGNYIEEKSKKDLQFSGSVTDQDIVRSTTREKKVVCNFWLLLNLKYLVI